MSMMIRAICFFLMTMFLSLTGCDRNRNGSGFFPASSSHKPIPAGVGAKTQKDYNRTKYAWMVRHTLDAFKSKSENAVVRRDDAEAFLLDACRYFTKQESAPTAADLEENGRTIINAGCDDPLVLSKYANILYVNYKHEEAEEAAVAALEMLQTSSYPDIHIFDASYLVTLANQCNHGKSRRKMTPYWEISERALREAIRSGCFKPDEVQIAFRSANYAFDDECMIRFHNLCTEINDMDPWLKKMIEGTAEIKTAWEKRGNGPASEVTDEGWAGFREHLGNARWILTEAWKCHPEYPEAAAEMITVAMAGQADPGDSEHLWFNRSVSAQMDFDTAYYRIIYALEPRWGGNQDAMSDFGEKCLNTRRFDTDVPLFYLLALRKIASTLPDYAWRAAFRQPGVHEKLDIMFEGLLNDPDRAKDRDRILAQRAVTEAWCGNYENAKMLLEQVPDDLSLRKGFWGKAISWSRRDRETIEAELRLFTGLHAETLKKAERLQHDHRPRKAAALFDQVMKEVAEDKDAYDYLLRRTSLMLLDLPVYRAAAYGVPAMYYAALENRVDVARFLYERGSDLNERHLDDSVPLHGAAREGSAAVARFLVENGAEVNVRDSCGRTPLSVAISNRFDAVSCLFIEAGSDIKDSQGNGWSMPHCAIYYNLRQTLRLMIGKGIDPNTYFNGYSFLHLALSYDNPEVAAVLIECGADVKALTRNKRDWAPLHYAAEHGFTDIARILLDRGAIIDARNSNKWAPLHVALYNNHPGTAKLLINRDAAINGIIDTGWTALHMAAYQGYTDIVKMLIEKGADLNKLTPEGETPLLIAQKQNHAETVKMIVSAMKQ